MQDIDALIKQEKDSAKQFSIISAMLKTGVYFLADYRDMVWQIEGSETRGCVISFFA